MTNKFKILKIAFLTIGFSLFLWNCAKNDDIQNSLDGNNLQTSKQENLLRIEQRTLKSSEEPLLIETLVSIKSKKNITSKGSDDKLLDFETSLDDVKIISTGDTISYTFIVNRKEKNDDFFENLVVQKNGDNGTTAMLVRYFPAKIETLPNLGSFAFEGGHTEVFDLTGTSKNSLTSKEAIFITITELWCNYGTDHLAGSRCIAEHYGTSSRLYTKTRTIAVWVGGITTFPTGSSDSYSDTDPRGGGTNSTYTSPNVNDYKLQAREFNFSLPAELRSYMGTSGAIYDIVHNHLRQSGYLSAQDEAIVIELLAMGYNLQLNADEFAWIYNNRNSQDLMDIKKDLTELSVESITTAVMKINVNRAKSGWDYSNTGVFPNRPSLTYKATFKPNQGETMYLLNNGLVLYQSSTKRVINKVLSNTIASSEVITDGYNYIYNYSNKTWYEYRLPPATPNAKADIDFLLDAFWDGAKIVGRYATPLEDAIILIDGKDFDGIQQSKVQTAGFMIVGLIPGGKALKPVTKIVNGVTKYRKLVKVTVNGVTENVSLPINIINGIVDFGSDGYNRTQLRKTLNITDSAIQGHHIVPLNLKDLDIVQKAAKSDNVFHISDKLNGIPLPSTNHLTGHNSIGGYSDTVRDILIQNAPNINSYDEAYNFLNGLTNHIRGLIEANPNMNMGQISNLISYP